MSLCKAIILLRLRGCCFPLMYIIHHQAIDVSVLWLLESSCPLSLIPQHSLSLVRYRMFLLYIYNINLPVVCGHYAIPDFPAFWWVVGLSSSFRLLQKETSLVIGESYTCLCVEG